jgi:TFIIF-interacting CTD phosphatase-like protein
MLEKIFWFGVGFFVARYLILNTPDYRAQETQKIDEVRNKVHDLIKKYVPSADDGEIADDVLTILPEN